MDAPQTTDSWNPTSTGYRWRDADLIRSSKGWRLEWRGSTVALGRRASFDRAEGALLDLGWETAQA